MSLTQRKNDHFQLERLANIIAIFALILHIFTPVVTKGATPEDNVKAGLKTLAFEQILTEKPGAKLLASTPKPDRVVAGVITAYTSTVDQTDDTPFIAASGKRVYDGMIAVNGLPFGTRIKIPSLYGEKIFTVHDRMNRRYSCAPTHCRMDIWLDTSKKEAMKFGVKRVDVEIFYEVKEIAKK